MTTVTFDSYPKRSCTVEENPHANLSIINPLTDFRTDYKLTLPPTRYITARIAIRLHNNLDMSLRGEHNYNPVQLACRAHTFSLLAAFHIFRGSVHLHLYRM
jgi:hypothetical protein